MLNQAVCWWIEIFEYRSEEPNLKILGTFYIRIISLISIIVLGTKATLSDPTDHMVYV